MTPFNKAVIFLFLSFAAIFGSGNAEISSASSGEEHFFKSVNSKAEKSSQQQIHATIVDVAGAVFSNSRERKLDSSPCRLRDGCIVPYVNKFGCHQINKGNVAEKIMNRQITASIVLQI